MTTKQALHELVDRLSDDAEELRQVQEFIVSQLQRRAVLPAASGGTTRSHQETLRSANQTRPGSRARADTSSLERIAGTLPALGVAVEDMPEVAKAERAQRFLSQD